MMASERQPAESEREWEAESERKEVELEREGESAASAGWEPVLGLLVWAAPELQGKPAQAAPESQGKPGWADSEPVQERSAQADRKPVQGKPVRADSEPVQERSAQADRKPVQDKPVWAAPEQLEARTWLAKPYRLSSADSEEDKVDRKWEEADWGVGSAGHISENSGHENK